jgi:photosystem II 13kDa protein
VIHLNDSILAGLALSQRCRRTVLPVCMASSIQFIKGVDEPSVPDVKLTRSRDGSSGVATFVFTQPSVFEASSELGDITGLYLIDDEGTLQTVDVQAKFVNGKPDRIEAKYVMRSAFEWDRYTSTCFYVLATELVQRLTKCAGLADS